MSVLHNVMCMLQTRQVGSQHWALGLVEASDFLFVCFGATQLIEVSVFPSAASSAIPTSCKMFLWPSEVKNIFKRKQYKLFWAKWDFLLTCVSFVFLQLSWKGVFCKNKHYISRGSHISKTNSGVLIGNPVLRFWKTYLHFPKGS